MKVRRCQNTTKLLDYFTGKRLQERIRIFYGQSFLGVECITDVGGRAPTSNRANPYWRDFGCGHWCCGHWNRDIVLKSADSEPPTRSEYQQKKTCITNMDPNTDMVMVVLHLHRVVMAGGLGIIRQVMGIARYMLTLVQRELCG